MVKHVEQRKDTDLSTGNPALWSQAWEEIGLSEVTRGGHSFPHLSSSRETQSAVVKQRGKRSGQVRRKHKSGF